MRCLGRPSPVGREGFALNAQPLFPALAPLLLLSLPHLPAIADVQLLAIAQFGDPSSDGDGTFGSDLDYGPPCLNDSSHVLLSAELSDNAGGNPTGHCVGSSNRCSPRTSGTGVRPPVRAAAARTR